MDVPVSCRVLQQVAAAAVAGVVVAAVVAMAADAAVAAAAVPTTSPLDPAAAAAAAATVAPPTDRHGPTALQCRHLCLLTPMNQATALVLFNPRPKATRNALLSIKTTLQTCVLG